MNKCRRPKVKMNPLIINFFKFFLSAFFILFAPFSNIQAQAPCASLACENVNPTFSLPCACGGGTANNANRWCCAANNTAYPTKSQCQTGFCAPVCVSTACEKANTTLPCLCGAAANATAVNPWCCAATGTVHPTSATCCANAACFDADADGQASRFCSGTDCDDTDNSVFAGAIEGEIAPGTCGDGKDNDCDDKTDRCSDPDCFCAGGLVPCGRHSDDPTTAILENSPCSLCYLFVIVKRIIDFLLIAIFSPLLALVLIGAGVHFITAAGDPKGISQGKSFLKTAGIGAIIVIVSWLIIETVVMTVVPNSRPWRNWLSLSCPVAPCNSNGVCQTTIGEDAQNCPTDCKCDFDDVCEPALNERIDGAGGNPESCPECAICGDGTVDVEEYCDLGNFRGGINPINGCVAFGYSSGNLGCAVDCKIDFSGCR